MGNNSLYFLKSRAGADFLPFSFVEGGLDISEMPGLARPSAMHQRPCQRQYGFSAGFPCAIRRADFVKESKTSQNDVFATRSFFDSSL
jgi:hypothetical protein